MKTISNILSLMIIVAMIFGIVYLWNWYNGGVSNEKILDTTLEQSEKIQDVVRAEAKATRDHVTEEAQAIQDSTKHEALKVLMKLDEQNRKLEEVDAKLDRIIKLADTDIER